VLPPPPLLLLLLLLLLPLLRLRGRDRADEPTDRIGASCNAIGTR
jgi:hypothetical protein